MNYKKILVSVAIVACIGSAFAQGPGGGGQGRRGGMMMGGQFGRGGSPAMLLQREEVQTELKLTDDQKSKLTGLNEKMRDRMREAFQAAGGGQPDREKMQAEMQKVTAEIQKEVDAILTEDQRKRLRELSVQRAGNGAVLMPDVAKELGISEEQKTKIQTLQQQQGEATMALFEKMRNGELDRDQMREKMEANQKALDEAIAKVLTEDQKTKLKAMAGKPFTFAQDRGFGRGGGR